MIIGPENTSSTLVKMVLLACFCFGVNHLIFQLAFHILHGLILSAENLCKQFEPRSELTYVKSSLCSDAFPIKYYGLT